MYCGTCGKEIPDNTKSCRACGAVLSPEKYQSQIVQQKKNSPKSLIIGIGVVFIIGIVTVIMLMKLIEVDKGNQASSNAKHNKDTEVVYVISSVIFTDYTCDGQYYTDEYEFDKNGNPITRIQGGNHFAKYDEYGNIVEYEIPNGVYHYEYTYDDKNRIVHCLENFSNWSYSSWHFTWDERDNLIQVICGDEELFCGYYFTYDMNDQLIGEYMFKNHYDSFTNKLLSTEYFQAEYQYDQKGNVSSVACGRTTDDPVVETKLLYQFHYNDHGKLISYEDYTGNYGQDYIHRDFTYDKNGNMEPIMGNTYTYDNSGNLIYAGNMDDENYWEEEYNYEPVEMTHEAARRYRRWEQRYWMGSRKAIQFPYVGGTLHIEHNNELFFYYLIPNPIW